MRRGLMLSPLASPLVYPARQKDPRQGLRLPLGWPCHAPLPGPRLLRGAPTLPFAHPPHAAGADVAGAVVMPHANRPREADVRHLPTSEERLLADLGLFTGELHIVNCLS